MVLILALYADPKPEIIRLLNEEKYQRRIGQVRKHDSQRAQPLFTEQDRRASLADPQLRHSLSYHQIYDSRNPLVCFLRSPLEQIINNIFVDVEDRIQLPANHDPKLVFPRFQGYGIDLNACNSRRKTLFQKPGKSLCLSKQRFGRALPRQCAPGIIFRRNFQLRSNCRLFWRERLQLVPRNIADRLPITRARPPSFNRNLHSAYSMISVTAPAPTVWPPSRIAKRSPFSKATGVIKLISALTLSPGITISTPVGSFTSPVTSVVRK